MDLGFGGASGEWPENHRLMVWTPARLYTASQWAKDVQGNIQTKRGGSEDGSYNDWDRREACDDLCSAL